MTPSPSIFSMAPYIPPDAIFALTAEYNADPSPVKVNLGQGTYRDNHGLPWVLPSVEKDRRILNEKGLRSWRHPKQSPGQDLYTSRGPSSNTARWGGKGRDADADAVAARRVYIPSPTWLNHHLLFSSLGFTVNEFNYYNSATRSLDIDSYFATLRSADTGSVVVLHACAHNPTGLDPDTEQWKQIGAIIKERQLFPVFDAAYLGFNSGNYDKDAWAIRYFVNELEVECAVCLSFAKNMGLYGERVGVLIIATADAVLAKNTQSVLESLQRSEISNPAAFGAKIAEAILANDQLKGVWFEDLKTMSGRIAEMRVLFDGLARYASAKNWDHLVKQSGMFGFLGLERQVVRVLKDEYHIYMAENSRISIAGLNAENVDYVARSIGEVLTREQ